MDLRGKPIHMKSNDRNRLAYWLMFALLGLGVAIPATLKGQNAEEEKNYAEGLVDVKDVPGLPRALLIGDSVSVYYTVATRKKLDGHVNVHHIPVNDENTEVGLKHL